MASETPNGIDRAAIEAHAQRTTEQTALRKVRKALDKIEEAELAERRILRKILMVCASLAVLAVWLFCWIVFSGGDIPKQPPMTVPHALQQRQ